MEVAHPRCSGLDVHKKTVVACVMVPGRKQVRTFGTVTAELLRLGDWLQEEGVTHVAMESTGVYWKPVFNVLETTDLELLVVNAQHIKAVPGRKTDVKDAEWIADLLRHGLVRASFIPSRPQRELRELVRYRKTVVEQRSHLVQRIQKLLEGANIKLSDVASDIVGVSGMAMLRALANGESDLDHLVELAKTSLRNKREELRLALHGSFGPHQRFLLGKQLDQLEFLDGQISDLNLEVEQRLRPFEALLARLDAIPGIGQRNAEQILVEVGTDMSRFPSAAHFASWAKLCPGNDESAGKRRSGRTGAGSRWLRSTMVEAAWSASRVHNSYFSAQYHRLVPRRGKRRAAVAVAHSMLIAIYHLIKDGSVYQDLGPNHFDELDRRRITHHAVRRLQALGYRVTLDEVPA
jgi:transposase